MNTNKIVLILIIKKIKINKLYKSMIIINKFIYKKFKIFKMKNKIQNKN